jgi:hypothetical protein
LQYLERGTQGDNIISVFLARGEALESDAAQKRSIRVARGGGLYSKEHLNGSPNNNKFFSADIQYYIIGIAP